MLIAEGRLSRVDKSRRNSRDSMKISYNYQSFNRISFSLSPDEMDGIPSVSSVYFHGRKVGRLKKQRAAAIGFLAFRHLISNTLHFENLDIDPHLARQMGSVFEGDELFISPISNSPTRILPKENGVGLVLLNGDQSSPDSSIALKLDLDDFGIRYETTLEGITDEREGFIRTNLRLALVGQSKSIDSVSAVIASLLAADIFGIPKFVVRGGSLDAEEVDVAREAGVHVSA